MCVFLQLRRHIPDVAALILHFNTLLLPLCVCVFMYACKHVNASVCVKAPLWTQVHTQQTNLVHQHTPCVIGMATS